MKRRESRIIKDVNHKVSRALVAWAKDSNTGLKFEFLKGMRQTTKAAKSCKYSLNSCSYFQLQQFVDYKAKIAGLAVAYVDPAYTSQGLAVAYVDPAYTSQGLAVAYVDPAYTSQGLAVAYVDPAYTSQGLAVAYVDPAYTSQTDSRSGIIAQRRGFSFKRLDGVIEHSGVNAVFNSALHQALSLQE